MSNMNLIDHTVEIPSETLHMDIILHNILPRFPVKSLVRFKSVSKIWNQAISSYKFAKAHLDSPTSCHQFIFYGNGAGIRPRERITGFCLLSYDERTNVTNISQLDFEFENCEFYIVGSCRGLVCIFLRTFENNTTSFVVWNPATKEKRYIDYPEGSVSNTSSNVFGYVSSLDDYKIFVSFSLEEDRDLWNCFYLFSLRDSKWEKNGCLDNHVGTYNGLVMVDDTVYCMRAVGEGLRLTESFAGYNLVTKELKEFPRLDWLVDYSAVRYSVVKGCFTLICFKDLRIDAWTLRQSGDWSSWHKLFSLSLNNAMFLCISEAGRCLVKEFNHGRMQLKVIDSNQEAQEHYSQQGINDLYHAYMSVGYKESLVSPLGLAKADTR